MLSAALFQARRALQQQRHLLGAEHDRQPLVLAHPRQPLAEARPAQRDPEEEPQGRYRQVHLPGRCALGGQMQLIAPQILRLGLVRRAAEEPGEVGHHADVVVLGLRAVLAQPHVVDHPLTQRAHGCSGHRGLLWGGALELQTGAAAYPRRRFIPGAAATRPCRGSGLVLWRGAADHWWLP